MTRLGVLVSGRGTNIEAILRACAEGRLPAQVAIVASNRECPALDVARVGGVSEVSVFNLSDYQSLPERDRAMAGALQSAGVDLVVCAGYDRLLDEGFVRAFEGRLLNLHPSLLPAFAGTMDAIGEALRAGVAQTGVTVHLIEPDTVDTGRILAQEVVPVLPDDTEDTLAARIHAVEHRLLPETIRAWIEGRLMARPVVRDAG